MQQVAAKTNDEKDYWQTYAYATLRANVLTQWGPVMFSPSYNLVQTGSGDGLPMLTEILVAIYRHKARTS